MNLRFPIFPILLTVLWATPVSGTPKNVLLVVADDQGLEAGCYGNSAIRTPHLDALAAEGTRFTHAFCTTASCSPSRSVLLTGLVSHATGQYGLAHAEHHFVSFPSLQSLPVLLAKAGYRTCSIGKFHVEPREVYAFDRYANDGIQGGRNAVRMAENARRFIVEDDDRPFFIYFCGTDPHRAREGFANEADYPGVEPVRYQPGEVDVPWFLPDRDEVRAELAEYYQAISRFDQGLGRLMEVLVDTGHWDDTLVVYLSDNGMPFPGAKTTLYEPGVRLPLIVRVPGRKPGVVSNAMVNWADVTPTILDYTGAEGPEYPLHGRSFLEVVDQPDPAGWDETYGSHTFHEVTMYYPMRSVRNRRYKYILNLAHALPFPFASDLYESATWQGVLRRDDGMLGQRTVDAFLHRPRHELYDLENDPHELLNLAGDTAHAGVRAELEQKLRAWQEQTGDPWRIKYEHE